MSRRLLCMWAAAAVALALVAGIRSAAPPTAANAFPRNAFDWERALAHVEKIAAVPHPAGTPAHERARVYVAAEMAKLADEAANQNATAVRNWGGGYFEAIHVKNLCSRLNGSTNAAILLSAHYDSVPTAPGASDDGHGVGVLLECMRLLKNDSPHRNPVIFLATDAEENGLFGAEAFVRDHPWRSQVKCVLNLEARGSNGADWMFRSNPGSGWMVDALAKHARFAQANSFSEEVFRFLPNDTDLSVFRRAGYPGLDFAYIGAPLRYHSMLDGVDRLDRDSLYQSGTNTLDLVRYLANTNLWDVSAPDEVYYGTGTTGMLHYPKSWAVPVSALVLIAYLVLLRFQRARFAQTLLCGVLQLAASFALAGLCWWIEGLAQAGQNGAFAYGYREAWFQAAFLCASSGIALAFFSSLVLRLGLRPFWMGILGLHILLVGSLSVFMPGTTVTFLLSVAAGTVAAAIYRRSAMAAIGIVALGFAIFGQQLEPLLTAIPERSSAVAALFLVLSIALLAPAIDALLLVRWWVVGAFSAAAVTLACVAYLHRPFDAQHPAPDSLMYALDLDNGTAEWLTSDAVLDGYTRAALGTSARMTHLPLIFPGWNPAVWASETQPLDLAASQIRLSGSRTQLDVDLAATSGTVLLYPGGGTAILSGSIDGRAFPDMHVSPGDVKEPWLRLTGNAGERWTLHLSLQNWKGSMTVFDRAFEPNFSPRPPGFMQRPYVPDEQLLKHTVRLP